METERRRIHHFRYMVMLSIAMLLLAGCGKGHDDQPPGRGDCASNKTCPTADAGPDQEVVAGAQVTLDGSRSTSGTDSLLTYEWTLTEKPVGSAATLLSPVTVRPTFTADLPGTYTAKLVVSNGGFQSKPDTVNVTASTGNLPPIADAGPDRTEPLGQPVLMDGTRSVDPNGTSVTYAWRFLSQPPQSQAVLINPTSATPSFTPDVVGTYKLALTVSDSTLTSPPDQVDITVTTGNCPPVADAGPDQQVTTGLRVTLTGAGSSDPNRDPLTYRWRFQSKPDGSTASLADAGTVNPTFTPDIAGFYVLSLVVSDGKADSVPDTVVIEARLPGFVNAVLQAYVKASNTKPGDLLLVPPPRGIALFGSSVALSGDTLAVGAPGERSCATGINGDQADIGCLRAGAVYVFTRTGGSWTQQAFIKPSNTRVEQSFGSSVALNGDALAVGAPGDWSCAAGVNGNQSDVNCFGAGAVYLFTRTAGAWSQQAYVKASNTAASQRFGASVALNSGRLAVGAPGETSCATGINGNQTNTDCNSGGMPLAAGAVYLFTQTGGAWNQEAYVKASNTGIGDGFGSAVVLNGETLAVAATGESSCALGINGNQADNSCTGAGAVYVFTRSTGGWSQQTYVKASNTDALDEFGFSLALANETLAVGARNEASCGTGLTADQADNACPSAGAVYVFTRTASIWSQQAYLKGSNTATGDGLGSSVALSLDTLAVGAPREPSCATGVNGSQTDRRCTGAGAVYVFERNAAAWSEQAYVKASNTRVPQPRFHPSDEFGFSVALTADTLAVGAHQENSCATGVNGEQFNSLCFGAGAVYVYVSR